MTSETVRRWFAGRLVRNTKTLNLVQDPEPYCAARLLITAMPESASNSFAGFDLTEQGSTHLKIFDLTNPPDWETSLMPPVTTGGRP